MSDTTPTDDAHVKTTSSLPPKPVASTVPPSETTGKDTDNHDTTTSDTPEPSRKRQRTSSPEPIKKLKTNGASCPARSEGEADEAPPLPDEAPPPLPNGAPPLPNEAPPSDGWEAIWEESAAAYYFYNHFSGLTQWTNPRVPEAAAVAQPLPPGTSPTTYPSAPGTTPSASAMSALLDPVPYSEPELLVRPHGGYNPTIHGSYDPTASYALRSPSPPPGLATSADPYAATAAFNRFTGKFQAPHLSAERHSDENKSKRQMEVYFDVDAAANCHNGKSLKAERREKSSRLTKQEVKAFKEKQKSRKEEKRRAWLKD